MTSFKVKIEKKVWRTASFYFASKFHSSVNWSHERNCNLIRSSIFRNSLRFIIRMHVIRWDESFDRTSEKKKRRFSQVLVHFRCMMLNILHRRQKRSLPYVVRSQQRKLIPYRYLRFYGKIWHFSQGSIFYFYEKQKMTFFKVEREKKPEFE